MKNELGWVVLFLQKNTETKVESFSNNIQKVIIIAEICEIFLRDDRIKETDA